MEVNIKRNSDERIFWKYYVHLINTAQRTLTDKEIDLLVEILSSDYYKSAFKGELKISIMKRLSMKNESYFSRLKKSLVKKGFLQETGVVKGDVLLTNPLRTFQLKVKTAIKKDKKVNLHLKFRFDEV